MNKNILISSLTGKSIEFKIDNHPGIDISEVMKQKIHDSWNIPIDEQNLMLANHDGEHFEFVLVPKLKGGIASTLAKAALGAAKKAKGKGKRGKKGGKKKKGKQSDSSDSESQTSEDESLVDVDPKTIQKGVNALTKKLPIGGLLGSVLGSQSQDQVQQCSKGFHFEYKKLPTVTWLFSFIMLILVSNMINKGRAVVADKDSEKELKKARQTALTTVGYSVLFNMFMITFAAIFHRLYVAKKFNMRNIYIFLFMFVYQSISFLLLAYADKLGVMRKFFYFFFFFTTIFLYPICMSSFYVGGAPQQQKGQQGQTSAEPFATKVSQGQEQQGQQGQQGQQDGATNVKQDAAPKVEKNQQQQNNQKQTQQQQQIAGTTTQTTSDPTTQQGEKSQSNSD